MTVQPSMKSFLEFCESRPPELRYDYFATRFCAVGQYAESIGVVDWPQRVFDQAPRNEFWRQADGVLALEDPWNFGALTERVREYMGETK